jgi:hypothetical protein
VVLFQNLLLLEEASAAENVGSLIQKLIQKLILA